MKIFVLGTSGTGKTPFARRVAEALGIPCAGASAWVRERFPLPRPAEGASLEEREAFVAQITKFAIAELRRDPAISIEHLRGRIGDDCVIEGMRNPYDLVSMFDPRTDRAVFLDYRGPAPAVSGFEAGLDVIRRYHAWLVDVGICDADRVTTCTFERFGTIGAPEPGTLEAAIVDYAKRVPRPAAGDAPSTPSIVHANIPPLVTYVHAEYLYGMDPARVGELRRCTVFSISSYQGNAPAFQILLSDGALFSYLPPNALVDPAKLGEPELELADLVYHDCKSTPICVHEFDILRGPVLCYFKRKDLWLAGTYLFTVDWYTTNELMHLIALANGQYALLPSHKIKFGDHPPGFEPYKKLRREWKVE